jgi:hypothetical protein
MAPVHSRRNKAKDAVTKFIDTTKSTLPLHIPILSHSTSRIAPKTKVESNAKEEGWRCC